MRRGLLTVVTLIVMLVLFTLPATAITFRPGESVDISADCNGYTITALVQIFGSSSQTHIFDYNLELTSSNGDVIETIVVQGHEIFLECAPILPEYYCIMTVTIEGSWGVEFCGLNFSVSGRVNSICDGDVYDFRNFGPVSFDCPCDQPPDCGDCDGKVTQLTLQYNGDSSAQVKVEQKKGEVVFNALVSPGGQFTFDGEDKNNTLGTEISVFVDGVLNTKIHTSCSQPIGPGLVSGEFEVIEGYSLNGGLLCEAYNPPLDGDCDGKVTQLTLQYNGPDGTLVEVMQKMKGSSGPFGRAPES